MSNDKWQAEFSKWKACVIIPTYNNDATLGQVIDSVLAYTAHIIVVNDGSTDQTREVLATYEDRIHIHHCPINRGKGIALRTGFQLAIDAGYAYAITLDSDGQHRASDIPRFFEVLQAHPGALLIGARNMGQDNVPGSSSFGHKFSNFWYQIMTGNKLPDTQSGYRLYPLNPLAKIHLRTTKYELEMEALVRLGWQGIETLPVPIDVYYPPQEERITHFRKIPDFSRIFVLNTLMVIIGLLYARPLLFFKELKKKSGRAFLKEYIFDSDESNQKITYAVMLGLFIGVSPFWGYQIMLVIFFCVLLRLNKVIALVAAHISIPPMIPLILYSSYRLGQLVLFKKGGNEILQRTDIHLKDLKDNLIQYVIGSFSLGVLLAMLAGAIVFPLLLIFRKKKEKQPAESMSITHARQETEVL